MLIHENNFVFNIDVEKNSAIDLIIDCSFSRKAEAPDVRELSFVLHNLSGR